MRKETKWIFLGGLIGLVFSFPLLFVIPYITWSLGKIFSISCFMKIGCIDSCKSFTLIVRSIIIIVLSILFGSIIGRKIELFIKRRRRDDKN